MGAAASGGGAGRSVTLKTVFCVLLLGTTEAQWAAAHPILLSQPATLGPQQQPLDSLLPIPSFRLRFPAAVPILKPSQSSALGWVAPGRQAQ